jgi:hypothetical protein
VLRGGPHDLQIDRKVAVHEDVTHSSNVCPGYGGVSFCDRVRQRNSSFSYDLNVMDDGIHGFPITGKCLEVEALDIRCDAVDGLLDVFDAQPPIPRRHELPLSEFGDATPGGCHRA